MAGKVGMKREPQLRVSEIYVSVQGEGPRVGEPTVFLRFGGCNLRCPGWPCDTQHAIDPKFRSEWKPYSVENLYDHVWALGTSLDSYNLCLTGGEPFLQNNEQLRQFVLLAKNDHRIKTVECFSNGTFIYPDWALDNIKFIMDWKLPGSGEDHLNAVRFRNVVMMGKDHAIKFVIKDRKDYETAKDLYGTYIEKSPVQVFYGAVWGAIADQELVEWVLTDGLPWRLNVQVHNHIWDRTQRGI